jgi:hypothetical protein
MQADPSLPPFVLITTGWLKGRSGTEVVCRDFALGLARRGWRVAIYAPTSGPPMATELEGRAEVITDLARLERPPDILHGHHHPTLVPALVRFPDAPAIQLCHDARIWFDEPLTFERIRRHAAVDRLCRERVAREAGVPLDSVTLLPNALDLDLCRPRPPLPERALSVLIVAHHANDHVAACTTACERAGLQVALAGSAVGRQSLNLPADMARVDIVIGAARIALEAVGVGCAAVVCDERGLAGMAASVDFEAWRENNFGLALLTQPVTPETVGAALAAYAPADAAALSAQVRQVCGLEPAIDRLEALYRETILAHRDAPPVDRRREAEALAAYLQRFLAVDVWRSPWADSRQRLMNELNAATARLDGLMAELGRRGFNVEFGTTARDGPKESG